MGYDPDDIEGREEDDYEDLDNPDVGFGAAPNADQDEFDRISETMTSKQNREFGRAVAKLFLEKRAARKAED